jgi:hypothetical protein
MAALAAEVAGRLNIDYVPGVLKRRFYKIDLTGNSYGNTLGSYVLEKDANVVSSELDGKTIGGFTGHAPALDIDVPAYLIESGTPGHTHLYLDVPMTWSQYMKLLKVMAEVGILQASWVDGALQEGATVLRVPWKKKKQPELVDVQAVKGWEAQLEEAKPVSFAAVPKHAVYDPGEVVSMGSNSDGTTWEKHADGSMHVKFPKSTLQSGDSLSFTYHTTFT